MKVQYYIPSSVNVLVNNPEVIPLLIQVRWYGQRVRSGLHLTVSYHEENHTGGECTSAFHNVHGVNFDDSPGSPYRKVTLRLEGQHDSAPLFAILELNMDDPRNGKKLTLSPVPFGPNGKPQLPYNGEELEDFLHVVRAAFLSVSRIFTAKELVERELTHRLLGMPWRRYVPVVEKYLNQLCQLGLVEHIPEDVYQVKMDLLAFENIFGVKFT